MIETLITLYSRDLHKLKEEINLYTEEANLWKTDKSITNSGGNLCLHLIGNLKTYIGNGLSDLGYARDREYEFSAKNINRSVLLEEIEETATTVLNGLKNLKEGQLKENFPISIWEEPAGMTFTLWHLHSHLNYHLGQINYHRRLLD